ncbi:MAG: hypothetical protein ACYC7D_02145 [Nitrososphaerales archaeon]
MNKVRKLAEDLVEKHPSVFSTDFAENKQAMGKVVAIRNRALRNQVAGTISAIIRERNPKITSEEGAKDSTMPDSEMPETTLPKHSDNADSSDGNIEQAPQQTQ